MPTEIRARDIMVTRVITARPNQTVLEAAKLMRDEDVGSVIVCEGTRPIGIATREDIVSKVVALDKDPKKVLIKDIMNTPLVTCSADEDVINIARTMSKYGYERIPVVDFGKLVGIVSVREIAKVSSEAVEILRERFSITTEGAIEEINSGYCELCGNYSEILHYVNDRWVCDNCKDEAEEI
ncbi:MAG: CBS domain-containing protein [Candidatus Aenigmatarchaeota archaeon]|nr:CBS domain-containing protein [Candidatus Aenigmarchaeota archaeon]